jgi:anti-sigma factor RsiW
VSPPTDSGARRSCACQPPLEFWVIGAPAAAVSVPLARTSFVPNPNSTTAATLTRPGFRRYEEEACRHRPFCARFSAWQMT